MTLPIQTRIVLANVFTWPPISNFVTKFMLIGNKDSFQSWVLLFYA